MVVYGGCHPAAAWVRKEGQDATALVRHHTHFEEDLICFEFLRSRDKLCNLRLIFES